jgi:hypothetical protein
VRESPGEFSLQGQQDEAPCFEENWPGLPLRRASRCRRRSFLHQRIRDRRRPAGRPHAVSFTVNGGASSLDIAGSAANPINICLGGRVPFDPECTSNFTVFYPAGTFAVQEQNGSPVAVSESQAVVTLDSSVTANPPPASAPEPRLCLVTGLALVRIGSMRRRKSGPTSYS